LDIRTFGARNCFRQTKLQTVTEAICWI